MRYRLFYRQYIGSLARANCMLLHAGAFSTQLHARMLIEYNSLFLKLKIIQFNLKEVFKIPRSACVNMRLLVVPYSL